MMANFANSTDPSRLPGRCLPPPLPLDPTSLPGSPRIARPIALAPNGLSRPGDTGRPGLNLATTTSTSTLTPNTRRRGDPDTEKRFQEINANSGVLEVDNIVYDKTTMADFVLICELGSGSCGRVMQYLHRPSGNRPMAVKEMCRPQDSDSSEEGRRILMDLEVIRRGRGYPHIVQCFGYLLATDYVHIFMELMSTCLDRLLRASHWPIPEPVLGKVTVAVLSALHYLKSEHNIIHRDVKPSNILLDAHTGAFKLCDFGISGRLVESYARTRGSGCAGYMAPERIQVHNAGRQYDTRADIWSFGISLIEMATAEFPYKNCKNDFDVMTRIVTDDAPALPPNSTTACFSDELRAFVAACVMKNVDDRPKYPQLLEHPFVRRWTWQPVDVRGWYRSLGISLPGAPPAACAPPPTCAPPIPLRPPPVVP